MGYLGPRYKQYDSGDSEDGFGVRCVDFRVFIYGVEVTQDIIGSVSIERQDKEGEGTCSFTLDNNYEKYVLRSQNFQYAVDWQEDAYQADTWNTAKMALSNPGKMKFIGSGIKSDGGYFTYHETAKEKLYYAKLEANAADEARTKREEPEQNQNALIDYVPLFPLQVGSVVINRLDHIRVFILDPMLDTAEVASGDVQAARWAPGFTGFVDMIDKTTSQETGTSSISITCIDARGMLKRKRVLLNPDVSETVTPDPQNNISGLFSDIVMHTTNGVATTNQFADMSFEKTTAYLLCNASPGLSFSSLFRTNLTEFHEPGGYGRQQAAVQSSRRQFIDPANNSGGFGQFALGHVIDFPISDDNKTKQKILADWCALTTFGVNRTWYSDADVDYIGARTVPDKEFSAYSGFVHYLLPGGGIGIRNIIDRVQLTELGVDREYKSTLEIITEMCARLDYQFQVSGMGDILFEFPMYDFLPEHIGDDFKYLFSVGNSIAESNTNDDTESQPVTCLEVTGSYQDNLNQTDDVEEKTRKLAYTVYVASNSLAKKYGKNIENFDVPHLTVTGGDSPEVNKAKLAVFGLLEFTKRLAAMSRLEVTAAYNPFLYPNRPLLSFYDRRVGLIKSTTIELPIGQTPSTSTTLEMVRMFDAQGKCNLLTGYENTPFSYMSPDETLAYLFSTAGGFGTFKDIRSKYGVEVFDADMSNVTPGKTTGLKKWFGFGKGAALPSPEAKAAIEAMARKRGGDPAIYVAMFFHESRMNPHIKPNKDTTATGLFQLIPSSWDELVSNSAALNRLGSPIPPPVNGKMPKYDAGRANTKEAWSKEFMEAYPTVEDQIRVYDAYLTMQENKAAKSAGASGNIEDYRINTPERIGVAQMKPAKLDNYIDKGNDSSVVALTASEKKVNPGIDSADAYGRDVQTWHGDKADSWLAACDSSQQDVDTTKTTPIVRNEKAYRDTDQAILAGLKQSQQRDRTALGGVGVKPLPGTELPTPAAPPAKAMANITAGLSTSLSDSYRGQ